MDVETSKAALEIESPGDGYVLQLVAAGSAVTVGEPIAYIFAEAAEGSRPTRAALRAAQSLIRPAACGRRPAPDNEPPELGVELRDLARPGLITAKDVEAAAATAKQRPRPTVSTLPGLIQALPPLGAAAAADRGRPGPPRCSTSWNG